jgi:hypothetical protein
MSSCLYLVFIASGASQYSSSVPSYVSLTSGTSLTIPDLTSFGLRLPTSTDYTWAVYDFGPYADVDAASAGFSGEHRWESVNPLSGIPVYNNLVNSSTGGFVTASYSSFTTAP